MKRLTTFCVFVGIMLLSTQTFARRVYVKLHGADAWSAVTADENNVVMELPENSTDFFTEILPSLLADDEVWVAAGEYKNTGKVLLDGFSIYGGFAGTETALTDRIRNDKDGNEMVDAWEFTFETNFSGAGNDVGNPSSFQLVQLNANSVLDGVTLSDNYYTASAYAAGGEVKKGAVISNCIIRDLTIESTAGNVFGGGLFVSGGGVEGCLFENCVNKTTNNAQGGAIHIYGTADDDAATVAPTGYIKNSMIRNCTSGEGGTKGRGGAIYGKGGVLVENCVIYNNLATQNGAAFYFHTAGDAKKRLNRVIGSTLVNNVSAHASFPESSYIEIYNTVMWGNSSAAPATSVSNYNATIRLNTVANTTSVPAYPYIEKLAFHGTITNEGSIKNTFSPLKLGGAIGDEASTDPSPKFTRATTFQGVTTDADKLAEIRKANFTPATGSPLIAAGITQRNNGLAGNADVTPAAAAFLGTDIRGTVRGSANFNIGAYEYGNYDVTVTITGNGTVQGYTSGTPVSQPEGALLTYTIAADAGNLIKSVTYNNTDVTDELVGGVYTAPGVHQDVALNVVFEEEKTYYTVTVNITGNGTVDGFTSGQPVTKEEGEVVVYSIAATANNKIKSVTYNDVDVTTELVSGVYTAAALSQNSVLNVEFEAITYYTVTVNITGNGTVDGFTSGQPVTKEEGEVVVYTITAAADNVIKSVTYNDVDVTAQLVDGVYTAAALSQNSVLNVEFEEVITYYTVTVNITGNGTVDGFTSGQPVTKEEGEVVVYTITAATDNVIKSVTYNDVDVTAELVSGVYTAAALSQNSVLNVVFEQSQGSGIYDTNDQPFLIMVNQEGVVIMNLDAPAEINVYTLNGTLVARLNTEGETSAISLESKGVYVVNLKINGQAYSQKVVF